MRKLAGVVVFAAIGAIWLHILFAPIPKLPVGQANGVWVNACCEAITLRDGNMFVGDKSVAYYVIEKDKQGPYVLPNANIKVKGGKIEIDRASYPLKLHLNGVSDFRELEVIGDDAIYIFKPAPAR